jgi:gamma-butyrobetaine dioxygenase
VSGELVKDELGADRVIGAFEADPYARDAVAVRRWDDAAKDPSTEVRLLAAFVPIIARVARS